jgi:hypothetical protein
MSRETVVFAKIVIGAILFSLATVLIAVLERG